MILRLRSGRYLQVRLRAMVNGDKFAREYNSPRERMNNRTDDSTNIRCFVDALGIKPRGTFL